MLASIMRARRRAAQEKVPRKTLYVKPLVGQYARGEKFIEQEEQQWLGEAEKGTPRGKSPLKRVGSPGRVEAYDQVRTHPSNP